MKSILVFARKVDFHSIFERSGVMFNKEELEYQFQEAKQEAISLLVWSILFLIKLVLGSLIVVTLFVLLIEMTSKASSVGPVNITNIIYWFVAVPATISVPYYFLLRYICNGVKYLGMDKGEREIYWNLFQYLLVLPIILILVLKTVSMMVSSSSEDLWMHYGPIFDSKIEYYQPIWADMVNNGYAFVQSYITLLPPLESLL